MGNVNVKLRARCLVNGQIREAGEIVDLPEKADDGRDFAISFGDIVKPKSSASSPSSESSGKDEDK